MLGTFKLLSTGIERIFLGYHIQPGFSWKKEYLVAPVKDAHDAIDDETLKIIRAKRIELLEGEFVFLRLPDPVRIAGQVTPPVWMTRTFMGEVARPPARRKARPRNHQQHPSRRSRHLDTQVVSIPRSTRMALRCLVVTTGTGLHL